MDISPPAPEVDDPEVLEAWLKGKTEAEFVASESASSRDYVHETPKPIPQGMMDLMGSGWLDNILEESLGEEGSEAARSLGNSDFEQFVRDLDQSYKEKVTDATTSD